MDRKKRIHRRRGAPAKLKRRLTGPRPVSALVDTARGPENRDRGHMAHVRRRGGPPAPSTEPERPICSLTARKVGYKPCEE